MFQASEHQISFISHMVVIIGTKLQSSVEEEQRRSHADHVEDDDYLFLLLIKD